MFQLIIRKIRLIKHSLHYTGWICNNNNNNNNHIFEFCKKGSQEWYGQAHYITLDGNATLITTITITYMNFARRDNRSGTDRHITW